MSYDSNTQKSLENVLSFKHYYIKVINLKPRTLFKNATTYDNNKATL